MSESDRTTGASTELPAQKSRSSKWRPKTGEKRSCQRCGAEFIPYVASLGLFCSIQCTNAARRKPLTSCLNCGAQFRASNSRGHVYCSRACKKAHWKPKPRLHHKLGPRTGGGLPADSIWSVDAATLAAACMKDRVHAVCACGTEKDVIKANLLRGASLSCGCKRDRENALRRTKHGAYKNHRPSREYATWIRMVQRCENRKLRDYADYGARGIRLCARWRADPGAFLADMGERPPGMSIDRKDNARGYSCGKCDDCVARGETANCRWATIETQARNKRNNIAITYNGETLNITDWAKRVGIGRSTLRARVKAGWDAETTLTLPPSNRNRP
jgi:hypothetical protein